MNINKTVTIAITTIAMTATTHADFKKRPGGRADRHVVVNQKKEQTSEYRIIKANIENDSKKVNNKKTKHTLRRFGRRP